MGDAQTVPTGNELAQYLAKSRYKRYQHAVFTLLENPSRKLHYAYHAMNWGLITGSVLLSILVTMESHDNDPMFHLVSYHYDVVLLTWISTEYAVRVWSTGWKGGWRSRWILIRSLYMCMDAVIIIITSITYMIDVERSFVVFLRACRFLQVFRFIRIGGQKSDLTIMKDIVLKHSREMLTCYFFAFMLLFSGAYIVYIFEAGAKGRNITDMLDGLYWGFITVTSVGYGDLSPTTPGGKAIAGILGIAGVVFFGLPAGILGSGFAIQVAKQKTNKNWLKLRNPAATLIQTAWRNHTLKRELRSDYTATRSKLLPLISGLGHNLPEYYKIFPGISAICNSRYFDAFNVDLPLPENRRGIMLNTMQEFAMGHLKDKDDGRKKLKCISLPRGLQRKSKSIAIKSQNRENRQIGMTGTHSKYSAVIRFIIRVKYWTCVKNFRRERYPFVEISDIRDKNVQWHIEMLVLLKRIKERVGHQRMELKYMKSAVVEELYTEIDQADEPNKLDTRTL